MRNDRNIFSFEKKQLATPLPCPASDSSGRKGGGNAVRIVLLYFLFFFIAVFCPGVHALLAPAPVAGSAEAPQDANSIRLARTPATLPAPQGALHQWHLESMLLGGGTSKRVLLQSLHPEESWRAGHGHTAAALQRNSLNPARLLAYNFLRVSDGEWIPLCRPFSREQLYAGAIRSFLSFYDKLERMNPDPA